MGRIFELLCLDDALRLGVEGGRGLVQEEDGGVPDERPRDGDPLLLAPRQLRALRPDLGVVALCIQGDTSR